MLVCGICSIGECVVALKSMIGSTAQQFLTFLSHRGEETGNIRGSMKVRVPTERLGTRERLYGGGSTGVRHVVVWARCRRSRARVAACWNAVVLDSSAALTGSTLRESWEGTSYSQCSLTFLGSRTPSPL